MLGSYVTDCLTTEGSQVLDSPHTAFTPENIKARKSATLIRKQLILDDNNLILAAGLASEIFGFFRFLQERWTPLEESLKAPDTVLKLYIPPLLQNPKVLVSYDAEVV